MRSRSLFPALLLAIGGATAPHAAAAEWLGKPDCRIAPVMPAPTDGRISWSGACKDGYAHGQGRLEWQAGDKDKRQLDGNFDSGEPVGEGTLRYRVGKYIGMFRQGMPHGPGYFEYKNGDRYEGQVVNGAREGSGVYVAADGTSYQGSWKAGLRDGSGKAIFTLGGSYEGEWRDDAFEGKGKIVYAGSGRAWEGQFQQGRAAGAAAPQAAESTPERFVLGERALGSNIARDNAIGSIPHDATWEQLTPAQRDIVRSFYPALADGDEPPYPAKGVRPVMRATSELFRRYPDGEGNARVYVLVGADGKAKSASTFGMPNDEFGRHLSMVVMLQRFKPAVCDGQPCDMIYPILFRFMIRY